MDPQSPRTRTAILAGATVLITTLAEPAVPAWPGHAMTPPAAMSP